MIDQIKPTALAFIGVAGYIEPEPDLVTLYQAGHTYAEMARKLNLSTDALTKEINKAAKQGLIEKRITPYENGIKARAVAMFETRNAKEVCQILNEETGLDLTPGIIYGWKSQMNKKTK